MVTYEEALKLTIEGDTVFLVGSGFSTGAENVVRMKIDIYWWEVN